MIRTVFFALVLTALPSLAISGCSRDHEQVMSCAEGMVWDSASQGCIAQTTS